MNTEKLQRKFARDGSDGLHYFVSMYVESTEGLFEWMDLSPDEREHAERALYDLYAASNAMRRLMEEIG